MSVSVVKIQSSYNSFTPYLYAIKLSFLKMLAYRLRYYTGILTYFLYVAINVYIWRAAINASSTGIINGYNVKQITTYIVIGWILRSFAFSNIDDEIDSLVSTGQITSYLSRPINFQFFMLSTATGEALFRVFMFSAPIAITLLLFFEISPPTDLSAGIATLISSILGFFIFAEINFLIGLLSFFLYSIRGIMRAKYFFIQLCSGLLIPISFLPDLVQKLLYILPFQAISYIPIQIYLGKISGNAIINNIILQIFWVFILLILGDLFWKKASQVLYVQGG